MSLPVSLIGTLVSIVPSVSPNEITSNPDSSNSPTISIGLIDAVSNDI